MSLKTTLHDHHISLGGRVVDFAGWMLPVQYEGVLAEHKQCRSSAVVFDTSHMGQFIISGPDAAAQLNRVGTQNAETMDPGACRYGFLLSENAGVIDDTILMRLGAEEFLLVVNAGPADGDFLRLKEHMSGAVTLANRTAEGWGKVDLQGPAAARLLQPMVNIDLAAMGYYRIARSECCGHHCIICRTGYTGELGYEIMAPSLELRAIFSALIALDEVKPAGLGARDSLRLEMGYPLHGHELSETHNPVEAGLGGFIEKGRNCIGASVIDSLKETPGDRKLIAFRTESRRRTNPGNDIIADGKPVGVVTSGAFAPSLEISIGMGYVPTDLAKPGCELLVNTGRCELPVTVCKKPMYPNGTCRTRNPL